MKWASGWFTCYVILNSNSLGDIFMKLIVSLFILALGLQTYAEESSLLAAYSGAYETGKEKVLVKYEVYGPSKLTGTLQRLEKGPTAFIKDTTCVDRIILNDTSSVKFKRSVYLNDKLLESNDLKVHTSIELAEPKKINGKCPVTVSTNDQLVNVAYATISQGFVGGAHDVSIGDGRVVMIASYSTHSRYGASVNFDNVNLTKTGSSEEKSDASSIEVASVFGGTEKPFIGGYVEAPIEFDLSASNLANSMEHMRIWVGPADAGHGPKEVLPNLELVMVQE